MPQNFPQTSVINSKKILSTLQYRLHAKYVAAILKEAAKKLRRMENINRASTAISRTVTVVGDLHGKLDDLLVILYKVNCYGCGRKYS